MKQFFLFFSSQFVYYALWALVIRSLANFWPVALVLSEMGLGYISFQVIDRITKSKDRGPALWGYVLGGAAGSLTSMYCSLWVFGK